MKVAFRLRRLAEAAPATALLLLSHRPEDVLRLCAGLGCDPFPDVYSLADGFLLRFAPRAAITQISCLTGVLRLRSLDDNVLLPVDAELVPALLEDEAQLLGRRRGLVFLPGGRVLGFDPAAPLAASALLALPSLRREVWQPLPQRPPLAERLTEITLEREELTPEIIMESGGEDIGSDDPRPAGAGVPARTLGGLAYGLGMGLARLGNALRLRGLARLGARLMSGALKVAPRLSEKLLGRQEAALRDLLREFREGNIERALRRALPLSGDTARGARPAQGSIRLPFNKIFYSLQELLRRDRGPATIWFSRFDAWTELQREYRKQAELALQRGDFRRAAFIYGKLLGDFRTAAATLAQGGLHRDAAILYLARVHDTHAAAREFEAAGELDRALALYRKSGEHALAGDLLRHAGEEELAIAEYRLAAAKLAQSGQAFYEAGELLLTRAGRPDLAQEYYQTGWKRRPIGSPVPCALRLAEHHCQQAERDKLLALVTEAEAYFAQEAVDSEVAYFFNEIAQLAQRPTLAPLHDELRDRALMAIGARMRLHDAHSRPADLASSLLAPAAGWSAAVMSDAAYATKPTPRRSSTTRKQRKSEKLDPRESTSYAGTVRRTAVPAQMSTVRAVCQAPDTGDVFIGFESGVIYRFVPRREEFTLAADEKAPILSLATDGTGVTLAVLSHKSLKEARLTSYVHGRWIATMEVNAEVPLLGSRIEDQTLAVVVGPQVLMLDASSLLSVNYGRIDCLDPNPDAVIVVPAWPGITASSLIGLEHGDLAYYYNLVAPHRTTWTLGWRPAVPPGSGQGLWQPEVSALHKSPQCLEIAAVESPSVNWSEIQIEGGFLARVVTRSFSAKQPFLAATIIRPGFLAAATRTHIYWLRHAGNALKAVARVQHWQPSVVACYANHRGNELMLICEDGTIARGWNLNH